MNKTIYERPSSKVLEFTCMEVIASSGQMTRDMSFEIDSVDETEW